MRDDQHIFVSHANQDHDWAYAACAALERRNLRCWVAPRDMKAGNDWPAQIVDAISRAALMVLVLSEHSNRSPQVLREVDRAINHNVAVLALRLGNFALSRNLEYFISMCHWLDADTGDQQRSLEDLCAHAVQITQQGVLRTMLPNAAPGVPHERRATPPAPAAASGTPLVRPAPAHLYNPDTLKRVESELASHLGPIARHLVRQAASHATNNDDLLNTLARELSTEAERHQFLKRCRNLS